jgi:hypothetical protein
MVYFDVVLDFPKACNGWVQGSLSSTLYRLRHTAGWLTWYHDGNWLLNDKTQLAELLILFKPRPYVNSTTSVIEYIHRDLPLPSLIIRTHQRPLQYSRLLELILVRLQTNLHGDRACPEISNIFFPSLLLIM